MLRTLFNTGMLPALQRLRCYAERTDFPVICSGKFLKKFRELLTNFVVFDLVFFEANRHGLPCEWGPALHL
jgi:hypothetical protein